MTTGSAKLPVALVGHRGYAGSLLHALLMQHPCMRPVVLEVHEPTAEAVAIARDAAAIALAVPDAAAHAWVAALAGTTTKVLDLSTAHRTAAHAHYGIAELFGPPPDGTTLVSNPGCYPTASLLAVLPLVRAGLVTPDRAISILGTSGTSGAGKALRDDLHFSAMVDNLFVYGVGDHKHLGELEAKLGRAIAFVPQVAPFARGLTVTAFVPTTAAPADLLACLQTMYAEAPWVTVFDRPGPGLGVRHVVGTHQAAIAVGPRAHGDVVPVFASIDNLLRGAASTALATLNAWLGLEAALGMPAPARLVHDVPGMTLGLHAFA